MATTVRVSNKYCCLNDSTPGYLASDLQHVTDLNARRWQRCSNSSALGPRTLRATFDDRALPAADASAQNSLPGSVQALLSPPVFRSRLKTELFARSYSCSDRLSSRH